MGRYLILGGTGRTGRRVLDRLTAQGDSTIIVSRHASSGKQPGIQDQTIVTGDLAAGLDPSLLDEVDGVVITVEPPTDPRQAAKVMNDGVAALARDCGERGVRIVLVSQIYITRAAAHPDLAATSRRAVTESEHFGPAAPRTSSCDRGG